LKSFPVCLSSEGGLSIEMEKVLASMPGEQAPKARRVLELNAAHPIFETLKSLYESNPDKAKSYVDILYHQALLIEGLPIEDPVAYTNAVCALMQNQ
ncbi:MAG: molecular chaperone HtpG, partial [Oscillospiraceae bacterium]